MVADKITKNHRKTLGLLRDIQGVITHGVIGADAATGVTEVARPLGCDRGDCTIHQSRRHPCK